MLHKWLDYQGVRVSGYQGIRVSGYQGIRAPGYQGIRVSGPVPGYQDIRVLVYLISTGEPLSLVIPTGTQPRMTDGHLLGWSH